MARNPTMSNAPTRNPDDVLRTLLNTPPAPRVKKTKPKKAKKARK